MCDGKHSSSRVTVHTAFAVGLCLSQLLAFPGESAFADEPPAADQGSNQRFVPAGPPDYTRITGVVDSDRLPLTEPEVLWKVTSEYVNLGRSKIQPVSDVITADGVMYFGDDAGSLTAYDIQAGVQRWTHEHGFRIAYKPSVDRDFVYFGSEKGITAIRRRDGAVVWQFAVNGGAGEATPLPIGDRLYASAYDGNAYCLDRRSGRVIWSHDFVQDAPPDAKGFEGARARFQNIAARPNGSSSDGKLFLQSIFDQSRVIALDCETGKRRWTFQTQGWIRPAPTISEGRVFIVSQDKNLYCVDRETGKLIWQYAVPSWLSSQVAVQGNNVFLPHNSARLYQLAADTGKLIRVIEPPDEVERQGAVYSFPVIARNTIYFTCGNGVAYAFDTETGNLRWRLRPSEGSEMYSDPATDGRLLFVTCRKNGMQGEDAILAIGVDP